MPRQRGTLFGMSLICRSIIPIMIRGIRRIRMPRSRAATIWKFLLQEGGSGRCSHSMRTHPATGKVRSCCKGPTCECDRRTGRLMAAMLLQREPHCSQWRLHRGKLAPSQHRARTGGSSVFLKAYHVSSARKAESNSSRRSMVCRRWIVWWCHFCILTHVVPQPVLCFESTSFQQHIS
jgi:hypothetical protein